MGNLSKEWGRDLGLPGVPKNVNIQGIISKSLLYLQNLGKCIKVLYRANTEKTLFLFTCEITCRNFGDSRVFGKYGAACGWQVILIVLDLEGWLERVWGRVGIGGLFCWYNAILINFQAFLDEFRKTKMKADPKEMSKLFLKNLNQVFKKLELGP